MYPWQHPLYYPYIDSVRSTSIMYPWQHPLYYPYIDSVRSTSIMYPWQHQQFHILSTCIYEITQFFFYNVTSIKLLERFYTCRLHLYIGKNYYHTHTCLAFYMQVPFFNTHFRVPIYKVCILFLQLSCNFISLICTKIRSDISFAHFTCSFVHFYPHTK
jgi:hypothetical protein